MTICAIDGRAEVSSHTQFNPAKVESFRLIGYENRVMANQDFAND
ncbi:MAG: YfbK domain-containing protein, partial [Isosphaeraceae bacterium]